LKVVISNVHLREDDLAAAWKGDSRADYWLDLIGTEEAKPGMRDGRETVVRTTGWT
jgi:hypothetical protein